MVKYVKYDYNDVDLPMPQAVGSKMRVHLNLAEFEEEYDKIILDFPVDMNYISEEKFEQLIKKPEMYEFVCNERLQNIINEYLNTNQKKVLEWANGEYKTLDEALGRNLVFEQKIDILEAIANRLNISVIPTFVEFYRGIFIDDHNVSDALLYAYRRCLKDDS